MIPPPPRIVTPASNSDVPDCSPQRRGPGPLGQLAQARDGQAQGVLGHRLGVDALAASPGAGRVEEVDVGLDARPRQLHPPGARARRRASPGQLVRARRRRPHHGLGVGRLGRLAPPSRTASTIHGGTGSGPRATREGRAGHRPEAKGSPGPAPTAGRATAPRPVARRCRGAAPVPSGGLGPVLPSRGPVPAPRRALGCGGCAARRRPPPPSWARSGWSAKACWSPGGCSPACSRTATTRPARTSASSVPAAPT